MKPLPYKHNSGRNTAPTPIEFTALWTTRWPQKRQGRSPAHPYSHPRRRSGRSPALPYPPHGRTHHNTIYITRKEDICKELGMRTFLESFDNAFKKGLTSGMACAILFQV